MTPTMIVPDLARPDTLPYGEGRRTVPSGAYPDAPPARHTDDPCVVSAQISSIQDSASRLTARNTPSIAQHVANQSP